MSNDHLRGKINYPVGLTSSVIGLTGLSLVWQKLSMTVLPFMLIPSTVVLYVATGLMVIMLGLYIRKWTMCRETAIAEIEDPIGCCMVATVPMAFLVQAAAWCHVHFDFALVLWWIGAPLQLAYAIFVIRSWMMRPHDASVVGPVWYLPIVGNLLAPLGGVTLGLEELSGLFFATGLVWWLILTPLIFYRLILVDMIPAAQMPTLMIMLAPPAVLYLGYIQLTGNGMELTARIALSFGLMMCLFMATLAWRFWRNGFSIHWWSMTFPSAAMANGALVYASFSGTLASALMAYILAALASIIILYVALNTLRHMNRPGFLPRFE